MRNTGLLPATALIVSPDASEELIHEARILQGVYGPLIQICDGSNAANDAKMVLAMDALPDFTYYTLGEGHEGKQGVMQFTGGQFNYERWFPPQNSVIDYLGEGTGRGGIPNPSNQFPMPYLGGTEWRFHGTTYPAWGFPKRMVDGINAPAISGNIKQITMVVDNPATKQANDVYAFTLDGWNSGTIDDLYLLSNLCTQNYPEPSYPWADANIKGLSLRNSSGHGRLQIISLTVAAFQGDTIDIASDHIWIGFLQMGFIAGAAPGDEGYALHIHDGPVVIDRFHAVVVPHAIKNQNVSHYPLDIIQADFENCGDAPISLGGSPINIGSICQRWGGTNQISENTWKAASIGSCSHPYLSGDHGGRVDSVQGVGLGGLKDVQELLRMFGADVKGFWPMFESRQDTVITDYSYRHHDGVASKNTENFMTAPLIKGRTSELTMHYEENDTVHGDYVYVPNHPDFSPGNGSTDSPFSLLLVVKPTTFSPFKRMLFCKDDDNAEGEYQEYFDTEGKLNFVLRDISASAGISIKSNEAFALNTRHVVWVTYDGSGLNTGLLMHNMGELKDSTPGGSGNYFAMEPHNCPLGIGTLITPDLGVGYIQEGAVSFAMMVGRVVTPSEVYNSSQIIKTAKQI